MTKNKIQSSIDNLGIKGTADILGITIQEIADIMGIEFKKFEDLDFQTHDDLRGVVSRLMFDNGYGVSVVRHPYSYGGDQGLYELAVLDSEGNLTYETEVTNDVIGYLTPEDVTEHMIEVQSI
jgi:hypothetical protein